MREFKKHHQMASASAMKYFHYEISCKMALGSKKCRVKDRLKTVDEELNKNVICVLYMTYGSPLLPTALFRYRCAYAYLAA